MQKTGRIVKLTTQLVDKADNLARLIQLVADNGANVLEIYHEREAPKSEVHSCTVTLTLETKDAEHIRKICHDMVESGFPLLEMVSSRPVRSMDRVLSRIEAFIAKLPVPDG